MRGIKSLKQALQITRLAFHEKKIPWYAKVIFVLILFFYILSPIDIVPDVIPAFGLLDDVVAIPLAILIGLLLIPKDVLEKLKNKTLTK